MKPWPQIFAMCSSKLDFMASARTLPCARSCSSFFAWRVSAKKFAYSGSLLARKRLDRSTSLDLLASSLESEV